jgi:hypothetical protein
LISGGLPPDAPVAFSKPVGRRKLAEEGATSATSPSLGYLPAEGAVLRRALARALSFVFPRSF